MIRELHTSANDGLRDFHADKAASWNLGTMEFWNLRIMQSWGLRICPLGRILTFFWLTDHTRALAPSSGGWWTKRRRAS